VGFVADPTLFELRRATVEIETQGAFTSGMTVVDFRGTGGPGERLVATSLDRAGFWEMMLNAIANIA
jgi:purine nucleosidase